MLLSQDGQRIVDDIAQRYGMSSDAVRTLLDAVSAGGGTMAQFSHPELGGMGQWSQGGMIMIGDMFNNALKARVDGVCSELSNALRNQAMYAPAPPAPQWGGQMQYQGQGQQQVQGGGFQQSGWGGGNWWPDGLGWPSSSGAQNDLRYAIFPGSRRLAIQYRGQTTVYDTGDHQIGGVQQQQGGGQSVTFTSQFGTFSADTLPRVNDGGNQSFAAPAQPAQPAPASYDQAPAAPAPTQGPGGDDIIGTIQRLADLHAKGVLSDSEFASKKAELLSRL